MFTHNRSIYLKDTDATGVIYFASLFQYALEAFEALLTERGVSLAQIFSKGYLMPVVHAEADYKSALRAGDIVSIQLSLAHVGNKSFSLESVIFKEEKETGRVKMVHAFKRQGEEKASEIPSEILNLLQKNFFSQDL